MGIDLYYAITSSPCRAVLMAAKHMGIELNLKQINILAQENMTPSYLKINPQHTIPTLGDNGFYMNESRAILQYFANKYGKDDSLYPKDPQKRAKVDQGLLFDMGTLYPRFGNLYYGMILRNEKMDLQKSAKLDEALGWFEGHISGGYAAGNKLTIADFTYAATLESIKAVGHDLSKFPEVIKYMDQCKAEIEGYTEFNQKGAEILAAIGKTALQNA